jgi:hypothetical protein
MCPLTLILRLIRLEYISINIQEIAVIEGLRHSNEQLLQEIRNLKDSELIL